MHFLMAVVSIFVIQILNVLHSRFFVSVCIVSANSAGALGSPGCVPFHDLIIAFPQKEFGLLYTH